LFYTGVGSRKTPVSILKLMTRFAQCQYDQGYTLRSGGAKGADQAFERGAQGDADIFYANEATEEAMDLARRFHPGWDRLSDYAKRLHGRNAFQVLGPRLNEPSEFLICWTPDGCITHQSRSWNTGGTGTAISIADKYEVPVLNLKNPSTYNQILMNMERD